MPEYTSEEIKQQAEQEDKIYYIPGDNTWEYKLKEEIWYTRKQGQKVWISLKTNQEANTTLDDWFPEAKKTQKTQKDKIYYIPGDNTWEYTVKEGVWHTRKQGQEKWISLKGNTEAINKLNKAFPEVQKEIDRKKEIKRKKEEADQKIKDAKQKVANLTNKKDKMQKKLARLAMPVGMGAIILMMVKKTLKSSFKAEIAISSIKKQFENKCPLVKKLKELIKTKNRIGNSVDQIQQNINTVQTTTQTINTIVQALSGILVAVNILIAAIGFIPPPFTAPAGPQVLGSKGAKTAKEKDDRFKKEIAQAVQAITVISFSLTAITTLLLEIEALISKCLIEAYENGDLTDEEVVELNDELNTKSTDSSYEEDDKVKGEELLASLQPNAVNPLGYRGFRLEQQSNPKDTTSFNSKRVVGYEMETNILTISTDYSFTTNSETLVRECRNLIDQYLIKIIPQPDPVQAEIIEEPELQIEYWGYLSDKSPKRWFLIYEGVEVEFESESEYFLDRIERDFPPDYSEFDDRGEDPGYTAPKTPYYWGWMDGSGAIFWHSGEIDYGLAGSNDYMFSSAGEYMAHRASHSFPLDFTDILNRGEEEGYVSDEDETAEQKKVNDAKIEEYFSQIMKIKKELKDAILKTSRMTNPNKNIWLGRTHSWSPEQWLNQKATNTYKRFDDNISSVPITISGGWGQVGNNVYPLGNILNMWKGVEEKVRTLTPNNKGINSTFNFGR